jgi:hypothetical protein
VDGGLITAFLGVSLKKMPREGGVWASLDRWIRNPRPRSGPDLSEPVRYAARWIGNLRSALHITEIEAQPVGSRINGRDSFYLTDTHPPNLSRSL